MRVFWKDGLRFESAGQALQVQARRPHPLRRRLLLARRRHEERRGGFSASSEADRTARNATRSHRNVRRVGDRVDWASRSRFRRPESRQRCQSPQRLRWREGHLDRERPCRPVQGALRSRTDHEREQHNLHRALADERLCPRVQRRLDGLRPSLERARDLVGRCVPYGNR